MDLFFSYLWMFVSGILPMMLIKLLVARLSSVSGRSLWAVRLTTLATSLIWVWACWVLRLTDAEVPLIRLPLAVLLTAAEAVVYRGFAMLPDFTAHPVRLAVISNIVWWICWFVGFVFGIFALL